MKLKRYSSMGILLLVAATMMFIGGCRIETLPGAHTIYVRAAMPAPPVVVHARPPSPGPDSGTNEAGNVAMKQISTMSSQLLSSSMRTSQ